MVNIFDKRINTNYVLVKYYNTNGYQWYTNRIQHLRIRDSQHIKDIFVVIKQGFWFTIKLLWGV